MVFTLNTFNTIGANTNNYYPSGYNISDVPTKFQSEFQANKDWLKFAFHAEDEDSNYNTSTGILTSYNTFVSAIYQLTGDYECIDRITRLGYFGGSLENISLIKNADYGIIGLYGADDDRAYDYYLSLADYSALRHKGKFIDIDNSLIFIKTQSRTFSIGKTNVEKNPMQRKITEFFEHEYSWIGSESNLKNRLLDLANWAKQLGYMFYYPYDIFR
jgi:hypothetical protein